LFFAFIYYGIGAWNTDWYLQKARLLTREMTQNAAIWLAVKPLLPDKVLNNPTLS